MEAHFSSAPFPLLNGFFQVITKADVVMTVSIKVVVSAFYALSLSLPAFVVGVNIGSSLTRTEEGERSLC